MALDYLTRLSGATRDAQANLQLGCVLALVAGAVNAGGFLAIGGYTSHMTGIVSGMADDLALGNVTVALAAFGAWLAFVSGAAVTAIMVNWGRRRQLHSQFATEPAARSAAVAGLRPDGQLPGGHAERAGPRHHLAAVLCDGTAKRHHHQDLGRRHPHHACDGPVDRYRH